MFSGSRGVGLMMLTLMGFWTLVVLSPAPLSSLQVILMMLRAVVWLLFVAVATFFLWLDGALFESYTNDVFGWKKQDKPELYPWMVLLLSLLVGLVLYKTGVFYNLEAIILGPLFAQIILLTVVPPALLTVCMFPLGLYRYLIGPEQQKRRD